MVTLSPQKRMASKMLKIGSSRVWMDPKSIDDISEAVTREDVRKLIKRNVIQKKTAKSNSRSRFRAAKAQRDKGRRKGQGSRKGTRNAREPRKDRWVKNVRSMRKAIREMRDSGKLSKKDYRKLYSQIKGGVFHNKSALITHLKDSGLLKGD
ncbi:MAG: 50S ribosomal protein L19e [Thermoplasmata archaeon]